MAIEFKPVTLADKAWIDELVMAENSRSADFNFGNIYIWDKRYKQLIARSGDRMLVKLRYNGKISFVYPVGAGPLETAVGELTEFAHTRGYPLRLKGITDEQREYLEKQYPDRFVCEPDKDCFDYIYSAENLASYSGKALHSKKNHCNRFEAEHEWSFVPLTRGLIPGCMDMLDKWAEENAHRLDKSISSEHDAITRTFAVYEELKLKGGVLFAEGKIVAFTIGEMANHDTFNVHFEKARTDINGAYPMVCREFSRMLTKECPQLVYINREDDMGLEQIRKSKLSYRPEYLLAKYTATEARG